MDIDVGLPDVLYGVIEGYDSGYHVYKEQYNRNLKYLKGKYGSNSSVVTKFRNTSNLLAALLMDEVTTIELIGDALEQKDENSLYLFETLYSTGSVYIPYRDIYNFAIIHNNVLDRVTEIKYIRSPLFGISVTPEMAEALFKKFNNTDRDTVGKYIVLSNNMKLLDKYVFNFYRDTHRLPSNILHYSTSKNIGDILEILKHTYPSITVHDITKYNPSYLNLDQYKILLDRVGGNLRNITNKPEVIEYALMKGRIEKGADVTFTDLPSPSLVRELTKITSNISLPEDEDEDEEAGFGAPGGFGNFGDLRFG